jgi:hypothetical protein
MHGAPGRTPSGKTAGLILQGVFYDCYFENQAKGHASRPRGQ